MDKVKKKVSYPFCDSTEVYGPRTTRKGLAIAVIFLGFPLSFIGRVYHCFSCSSDFKKRDLIKK
jgi:hypothetical protein